MTFFKNLATITLVLCAVLVTAAVVKREFFASPLADEGPRVIADWRGLSAPGQPLGPRDAPVVIVEFADFQCPFCATAARNLRELRSRVGDQVAVIYRHFPLMSIHPFAWDAAVAAECAGEQGRFEAFHDALFASQEDIGHKEWGIFAEEAAIPSPAQFADCLGQEWATERVREDARVAARLGLTGTPSVIVNDLLLPGTPSLEELEAHVLGLLAEGQDGGAR